MLMITPHYIFAKGSLDVLKNLQKLKKLNFNDSKDKDGNSYLLMAAMNGQLETFE